MKPVLSLILCSRNDSYMGDSRWRLETTLNYVADRVAALGRSQDVELLIADWGSDVPLSRVIRLSAAARQIVSFLHVPPPLARELQKDSPFPEVLALNAAARRATGAYIGRIDQDTLAGELFLRVFFDMYEGRRPMPFALDTTLLFSRRRSIPYRFAVRCPPLWVVERLIARGRTRLPLEHGPGWAPFYVSSVGIWLAHRQLWRECGGYDEEMIYMGAMESNMIARLMTKYQMVDLGKLVDHDFYHLEHHHPWAVRSCWAHRRPNDEVHRMEKALQRMNPNGEGWGLVAHVLKAEHGQCADAEPASSSVSGKTLLPFLFAVWTQVQIESLLVAVRNVPRRLAKGAGVWWHRLLVARATVRGKPFSAWPAALRHRLAHRERGPLVFPRNILEID